MTAKGGHLSAESRAKVSATKRAQQVRWSDEQRAQHSAKRRGEKRSAEHRARLSAIKKAWWASLTPEQRKLQHVGRERAIAALSAEERAEHMARMAHRASQVNAETSLERAVEAVLQALGVDYCKQHRLGVWIADFFIPAQRLVIECDGEYWHSKPRQIERDARKDVWMRDHGYRIVHLPEQAIRAGAHVSVVAALTG